MSLARGLGAAFEGFSKGVRLAGEEEERKTRQELAKRQMEAADLELAQKRRDVEYQREVERLYDDVKRTSQGGTSGELVDEFGVKLPGSYTYLGENRPEAAGLQFTGETKPVAPRNALTDPGYAEDVVSRQQQIDLRYGKVKLQDALKGIQSYNSLLKEGAFDAAQYFRTTGDSQGAIERFNAKGGLKFPEGAVIEPTETPLFPGVKDSPTQKSFVIKDRDGKVLTDWDTIRRGALNPKDALSLDNETGKTIAQFIYQTNTLGETKRHNTETERLRGLDIENQQLQYRAVLKRMDEAAIRQAEQLGIARDVKKATALQNLFTGAQKEVFNLTGFQPMKAEELQYMPDAKKNEYFDRLAVAGYGTSIFEGNVDINKGSPGITPAMAVTFGKAYAKALQDPAAREEWNKIIKTDEDGRTYVESGKQRVFVPAIAAPAAPAPAERKSGRNAGISQPEPAPANAAASTRRGVQFVGGDEVFSRMSDSQLERAILAAPPGPGRTAAEQELANRRRSYSGGLGYTPDAGFTPGN